MRTNGILILLCAGILAACGGSEGDAFAPEAALPEDVVNQDPQVVPLGITSEDLEQSGQVSDDFAFETIGDITIVVEVSEAGQPVAGVPVRVFTVRQRLFDQNDPASGTITEPGFQIAGLLSDENGRATSSVLLPSDETAVFVRVLTPGFGDAIVPIENGTVSVTFQRGA